jgi:hypothetical protein
MPQPNPSPAPPPSIESLLQRHCKTIVEMKDSGKKHLDIVRWLRANGVKCLSNDVIQFFKERSRQQKLLNNIGDSSVLCKAVKNKFGENPAPDLQTLMDLHRTLIFQIYTQKEVSPESIKLADQMTRNAVSFAHGVARIKLMKRRLKLAENKPKDELAEKLLDAGNLAAAEKVAMADMSQADKIAALRKVAFQDVEDFEKSGELVIPTWEP